MTLHTPLRASRRRSQSSADLNAVEEDKETNIKVIVRCRPLSEQEKAAKSSVVVRCDPKDKHVVVAAENRGNTTKKTYTFDTVHGQFAQQESVFEDLSSIVDEVLEGFNCTVFAYGQTGTGKTYTMQGLDMATAREDVTLGIIPRSVHAIFDRLASKDAECVIHVSCLEIYNEILLDLLSDTDMEHRIFEDSTKGVFVSNLEELLVREPSDIFEVLEQSWKRRQTGETKMNKASSRSHTIFTVKVHSKETNSDGEDVIKIGKLNLVDLAGSECIGKSEAVGKRAKEAGNINRSLLTLGRVINSLVQGHRHVPYRESKLTRLLQESLGGRAKTILIATISPSRSCLDETLKTLDYAHTAKNITNRPQVNQKVSHKAYVRDLQLTIANYKKTLEAMRTKTGVYMPNDQYEDFTHRVESEREELEQVKATLNECEQELDKVRSQNHQIRTEMEDTKEQANAVLEEMASSFQLEQDQLLESSRILHTHLKRAISDNELMRQNIDRRSSLEQHNNVQVKAMEERVFRALSASGQVVQEYVASQTSLSENMQKRVQEFRDIRIKSIAELSDTVRKHTEELKSVSSMTEAASLKMSADAAANASFTTKTMSDALEQALKETQNTVAGVSHECADITSLLEAQTRLTGTWCNEMTASIVDFSVCIAENSSHLSVALKQIQEAVVDSFSTFIKEVSSLRSSVEAVAQQNAAKANEEAAELTSGITSLIKAYVEKRAAESSSFASSTTSSLAGLVSTATSAHTELSSGFTALNDAHSGISAKATDQCRALSERVPTFAAMSAAEVAKVGQLATRLPAATSEALRPIDGLFSGASTALGNAANAMVDDAKVLSNVVTESSASIEGLRLMLEEDTKHFAEISTGVLQRHVEGSQTMAEAVKETSTRAQAAQRIQFDGMQATVAAFADPEQAEGFQVYKSTKSTPPKEPFPLPQSPKKGRVWSERLSQIQASTKQRSQKRRRLEFGGASDDENMKETPIKAAMEIEGGPTVLGDATNKA